MARAPPADLLNRKFAMKSLALNRSALREISLLSDFMHPNICALRSVYVQAPVPLRKRSVSPGHEHRLGVDSAQRHLSPSTLPAPGSEARERTPSSSTAHHSGHAHLVYDRATCTLGDVIRQRRLQGRLLGIRPALKLMHQLLGALAYLHERWVLHRDVKPSNALLFVNAEAGLLESSTLYPEQELPDISDDMLASSLLQLSDFGQARSFASPPVPMARIDSEVGTSWYRAPELLLGAEEYGPAVDIWSAGCVLAELLSCRVLCKCKELVDGAWHADLASAMITAVGAPPPAQAAALRSLPHWTAFSALASHSGTHSARSTYAPDVLGRTIHAARAAPAGSSSSHSTPSSAHPEVVPPAILSAGDTALLDNAIDLLGSMLCYGMWRRQGFLLRLTSCHTHSLTRPSPPPPYPYYRS